jgi:hypothetical protein
VWQIPGVVSVLILMYLIAFSLYHLGFAIRNLARNVTAIELWNERGVAGYDKGCLRNFEEVCGSRVWIGCWMVPCCVCVRPLEDGFYQSAGMLSEVSSLQTGIE